MHLRRVTRPGHLVERAVQFVDDLPALHVQRLGHGAGLVALGADALIRSLRAVTGRHGLRRAIALLAGRLQRRAHEVEVQVVDGQRVRPLVAETLQQRGRQLRHAGRAFGDRAVFEAQHGAATALLDHGLHRTRLVDGDRVLRVGEDHHAGLAAGIDHRPGRGDVGHVVRHGGDVGEQARRGVRPRLLARVPADQRNAALGRGLERDLLLGGVEATDDDAGGLERECLVQCRGAAADGALAVDGAHGPADRLAGFLNPLRGAEHATVLQVGSDEDDGLAGGGLGAGGRAVHLSLVAVDTATRFFAASRNSSAAAWPARVSAAAARATARRRV